MPLRSPKAQTCPRKAGGNTKSPYFFAPSLKLQRKRSETYAKGIPLGLPLWLKWATIMPE